MKHAITSIAAAVLIGGWVAGCDEGPVVLKPTPHPVAAAPQNRADVAQQLGALDQQYVADVGKMPGATTQDHRETAVKLLGDLADIIRLLGGSNMSPAVQNSLSIVVGAQKTVSDFNLPRPRMEAAENEALHASQLAFAELTKKYFYNDNQLPQLLDALDAAVSTASASVGPMHDLDATNAFVAVQAVVDRITFDVSGS